MPRGISRRHVLMKLVSTGALFGALNPLARGSQSAGLTPLDTKDTAASALGFVTEASNATSNPLYKQGQHCASCMHYLGHPSDATGGCNIYAGHTVPANGWCSVWSQRPG
jgi:hypothetical protein